MIVDKIGPMNSFGETFTIGPFYMEMTVYSLYEKNETCQLCRFALVHLSHFVELSLPVWLTTCVSHSLVAH